MNEPTRAVRIASAQVWLLGKCSLCGTPLVREEQGPFGQRWHYHEVPAEPAQEMPRPPAESSPEPPAGPERGTGEPEAHGSAQAVEYTPAETVSRILVLPWGTRHNREHVREVAEGIDATVRPMCLREAAASLRALARADRDRLHTGDGPSLDHINGFEAAADLLDSTATDLEDEGATS